MFLIIPNKILPLLIIVKIKPVRVEHAQHPFGFVVGGVVGGEVDGVVGESKQTETWKVVYSGDTMPCDALVEAGELWGFSVVCGSVSNTFR